MTTPIGVAGGGLMGCGIAAKIAAAGIGANRKGIAIEEIRAVSDAAMKRVAILLAGVAGGHGR